MFVWRRDLFDREFLVMLDEFESFINRYISKFGMKDKWKWRPDLEGNYSRKGAYDLLIQRKGLMNGAKEEKFKLVWNCLAPSKVRVHAWRVLWERIPTTTKL